MVVSKVFKYINSGFYRKWSVHLITVILLLLLLTKVSEVQGEVSSFIEGGQNRGGKVLCLIMETIVIMILRRK